MRLLSGIGPQTIGSASGIVFIIRVICEVG